MKNKLTDYKVDESIEFLFIGSKRKGKILSIDKDNLKVVDDRGMIYRVYMSEKESKYCYIV
jgi:hypothetical protein